MNPEAQEALALVGLDRAIKRAVVADLPERDLRRVMRESLLDALEERDARRDEEKAARAARRGLSGPESDPTTQGHQREDERP